MYDYIVGIFVLFGLCSSLAFKSMFSIPFRMVETRRYASTMESVLVKDARRDVAGPRELGVNSLKLHCATASSFGDLTSKENWLTEHSSVSFKIHRPTAADYDIHTTLLSPEIGRFFDNIRNVSTINICKDDTATATKLCTAMSTTFESDGLRFSAARDILCDYFGLPKNSLNPVAFPLLKKKLKKDPSDMAVKTTRNNGGLEVSLASLSTNPLVVALVLSLDGKAEMGSSKGAPFEQNFAYYMDSLLKNSDCLMHTRCPALLVSVVGPHISVQTAAFTSAPVLDPAVPLTPLLVTPHDPDALLNIARVLRALKNCVKELSQYYKTARPVKDSEQLVYPYANYFNVTHNNKTVKVYFSYTRPFQAKKLVYSVVIHGFDNISEAEKVDFPYFIGAGLVVKYTRTYNTDAHKAAYAYNKGAPKLFAVNEIPGGWKLVAMEHVKGEGLNDINKHGVASDLKALISHLHASGYVHGDLRRENIRVLSTLPDESPRPVVLLDFDWAGPVGETYYPPFMSNSVIWPKGAEDFAPITVKHDRTQLRVIYTQKK